MAIETEPFSTQPPPEGASGPERPQEPVDQPKKERAMLRERTESRASRTTGVWETIQEARRVAAEFQPEGATPLDLQPVHFKGSQRERALTVAFSVGTTIGTGHDGVLLIPERTRAILKQMNLPFTIFKTSGQSAG